MEIPKKSEIFFRDTRNKPIFTFLHFHIHKHMNYTGTKSKNLAIFPLAKNARKSPQ